MKCPKCGKTKELCHCTIDDTRPRVHDGDEPATDEVLNDMATQDAIDEFDCD